MFYFLMLFGAGSILLGMHNRRYSQAEEPAAEVPTVDGMEELKARMEQMEQLVFQSLVKQEEHKADTAEAGEEAAPVSEEPTAARKPMPDNIRAILDYESQGLSVQEISNIRRMNKGEVLLLKNLSKHYSK